MLLTLLYPLCTFAIVHLGNVFPRSIFCVEMLSGLFCTEIIGFLHEEAFAVCVQLRVAISNEQDLKGEDESLAQ